MPLKQMSYNSANKILNLYLDLLSTVGELKGYEKYGYSALQGYDIIDVSNAIKLITAYKFFNNGRDNESIFEDLSDYVLTGESAFFAFLHHFYPDGVAHGLSQIDSSNFREAALEYIRVTAGSENYQWNKLILRHETCSSFFKFCQNIGNKDPDFWDKVYTKLEITWETNDSKDKIYFIISNKDLFLETKKDDSLAISVNKLKTNESKSFFIRFKKLFKRG